MSDLPISLTGSIFHSPSSKRLALVHFSVNAATKSRLTSIFSQISNFGCKLSIQVDLQTFANRRTLGYGLEALRSGP